VVEASEFPPVIIGSIVSAYGVKGWVKVRSFTETPNAIVDFDSWLVGQDGRWQRYSLLNYRTHGQGLVVQLERCDDRDDAEALKGMEIAVDHSALPELKSGEYYWSDLLGKMVVNTQGEEYGHVTKLMETGANDVLVVAPSAGRSQEEILIPYVNEVVIEVDQRNNLIRVNWSLDY